MSSIANARAFGRRIVCGLAIVLLHAGPGAGGSVAQPARDHPTLPFAARSIPRSEAPQIVAIGEASHGNEAMLRERNRVILELAAEDRISWIALESGFAEARLLDDFVRGGPGNAEEVARRGFTSGFGGLAGNITLLHMVRRLNLDRPAADRIGITGIDLSLAGPLGSAPTMVPVDCALEGVADESVRKRLHDAFAAAVEPGLASAGVSERETSAFRTLSGELASALGASASPDTRQCARIVAQSADVFEAMPKQVLPGSIPADAWLSVTRRDQSMAANALAALARSGGKSILLFAHTSHVMAVPMRGGRWSSQAQPPQSMGQVLRERLGDRYLAIAEVEPARQLAGEGPPDLIGALALSCKQPCVVSTGSLGMPDSTQVRIGINRDDEQIIELPYAASFLLVLPDRGD